MDLRADLRVLVALAVLVLIAHKAALQVQADKLVLAALQARADNLVLAALRALVGNLAPAALVVRSRRPAAEACHFRSACS
jgi:hypothetical protein